MARDSVTIDFLLNTKDADRDLARIRKELQRLGATSGKAFKGFGGATGGAGKVRALGTGLSKATVRADEFTKSLEASNARVVAFGASAGIIMQIDRAFKGMVSSTLKVEKALLDVNVVLNASQKNIKKFGQGMFQVGKQTAQGFEVVAEAATELARQGLGMEKTLTRTKDALILTRLTGMDAAEAVKSLTAAVNSFNKEGVTSAQVINKMAKVDAAFAVSSDDLAKAISRVGASAVSAGVSMDELLAITTAVQQRTARGGAVIGNAFKTIFTRLQRKDVLQNLRNLGIAVTDFNGEALSGIQVLQNLAGGFNTLSKATQAQTAEQVAGVFQVNILKAAMADLSSTTSNYGRALRTSAGATDEAYRRNEQLNKSLDALVNRTTTNLTQAGASIGGTAIEPAIRKTLGVVNGILESFGDGGALENFGKNWGKGIMQGLGDFIAGPGLVVITATVGKLFFNLTKFTGKAFADIMNINKASQQRQGIQTAIVQTLAKEPALLQSVLNKDTTILGLEQQILRTLKAQTLERAAMNTIASPIAASVASKGGRIGRSGGLFMGASGFIPNFANAGAERAGAAAGGYKAGAIKTMTQPGGGRVMYNSAETVKRFPGMSQSAIMPPKSSSAGSNYKSAFSAAHGFNPYAAKGFVPNFMAYYNIGGRQVTGAAVASGVKSGKITEAQAAKAGYAKGQSRKTNVAKEFVYPAGQLGMLGIEGTHSGSTSTSFGQLAQFKSAPAWAKKQRVRFAGVQTRSINDVKRNLSVQSFSNDISRIMTDPVARLSTKIFGGALGNDWASSVSKVKNQFGGKRQLLPPGAEGSIFEAAVNLGLKATRGGATLAKTFDQSASGSQRPFDFEETGMARPAFKKAFGFGANLKLADAKRTLNDENVRSVIKKAYNYNGGKGLPGLPRPNNAALGFVPNFNPVTNAVGRELAGGVPRSAIRLGSASSLKSPSNPGGLGVYNTIHEPGGLSQGISRARSRGINPKSHGVPNFNIGGGSVYGSAGPTIPYRYGQAPAVSPAVSGPASMSTAQPGPIAGSVDMSRYKQLDKGMSDAGKAASDSAKASKEATTQTRRMGAAMGGMMAQMAFSAAAGQMEQGSKGQTITAGLGSIAGYGGMGFMMGGPLGGAAGAAIGGVGLGLDLIQKHSDAAEQSFERLAAKLEETQKAGMQVSEALGKVDAALGSLPTERDPEKRKQAGREIIAQLREAAGKLPEGSESRKKVEGMISNIGVNQNVPTQAEMKALVSQAERENQQQVRSEKFETIFAGTKSLASQDKGFGFITQEISEGNYGRAAELAGLDLALNPAMAAGTLLNTGLGMVGMDTDLLPTLGSVGNRAAEARKARAARNMPRVFEEFMGQGTIDDPNVSIGAALQASPAAMAEIEKLRSSTSNRYFKQNYRSNMDTFTKEGGGFELGMAAALDAGKIGDDAKRALKEGLNTPEGREAFLNEMFGRGQAGVGSGIFSTDVAGKKGGAITGFDAVGQRDAENAAEAVSKMAVIEPAKAAKIGARETRAFVEGLRKASVANKNNLSETRLEIAQTSKLRKVQNDYDMALSKATKDTLGVADEKLAQALKEAAANFNDASKIAKDTFDSQMATDMADFAKQFEKSAEKFDKGAFGATAGPIAFEKEGVPLYNPMSAFKESQIDIARGTFQSLGKNGIDALQDRILAVQERERGGTGTLSVEEEIVKEFGPKVLEKLKTRTEELDQKMKELGIQNDNAKTLAQKQAAIDKKMLEVSRQFNRDKADELAITKQIVDQKKLQYYEDLRAAGKMSASDALAAGDVAQRNRMRTEGINQSDIGGAFGRGFRGGMTYDDFALFDDLKSGGADTAASMKSSFADAFKSIASGATDARSAIVQFADGILNTISDVTARIGTNMLFSGMGFSRGGLVPGYNKGGIVTGGSGYKDDVPAMMNGGEFVIKKSSAQKIGYGALNAINSGGAPGYNAGGMFALSAGASMLSGAINSGGQSTPSATRGQDYGQGRGAYGYFGGADINATGPSSMSGGSQSAAISLSKGFNFYRRDPATGRLISERSRPTEGGFDVSSALSLQGRLNSADPQTARMFGREKSMGDYGNYLDTETARRKEVVRAHEAKKRGRLVSAYANAAMLIGGSYLMNRTGQGPDVVGPNGMSHEAFQGSGGEAYRLKEGFLPVSGGGRMGEAFGRKVPLPPMPPGFQGKAGGGSVGASPAMLTGGEYVMSPDTVRTHGLGFMNELNRGNVPGYAGGGYVGGAGGSGSNVNISVNVDRRGNPSVESSANNEGKENDQQEMQKNKQFGAALQTVVLQEIMKQQRPGGLLQKTN
jgi:TP901 family phage tail tape measure protein